jgi:hypothetical protein
MQQSTSYVNIINTKSIRNLSFVSGLKNLPIAPNFLFLSFSLDDRCIMFFISFYYPSLNSYPVSHVNDLKIMDFLDNLSYESKDNKG